MTTICVAIQKNGKKCCNKSKNKWLNLCGVHKNYIDKSKSLFEEDNKEPKIIGAFSLFPPNTKEEEPNTPSGNCYNYHYDDMLDFVKTELKNMEEEELTQDYFEDFASEKFNTYEGQWIGRFTEKEMFKYCDAVEAIHLYSDMCEFIDNELETTECDIKINKNNYMDLYCYAMCRRVMLDKYIK
jgi:hypothetical protein